VDLVALDELHVIYAARLGATKSEQDLLSIDLGRDHGDIFGIGSDALGSLKRGWK